MLKLYPLKSGLEIAVELLIQAVASCVCLCVKCSLYLSISIEHAKVSRSTM